MLVLASFAVLVCLAAGCGSRVGRATLAETGGALSANAAAAQRDLAQAEGGPATSQGGGTGSASSGAVASRPVDGQPGPGGAAGAPATAGASSTGAAARGGLPASGTATGNGAAVGAATASGAGGPSAGAKSSAGGKAPAGSSSGAPGPAPVPTPGGAPKAEIRLGSVGAESGVIGAAMAPIAEGARAWVADVNARGGVAGIPCGSSRSTTAAIPGGRWRS
ncbi:MAG TPA: hypothetical protein VK848_02960 [Acidimicrobiia bacterium]|nr:hypothetical protein [Acidimicrobiia bacterium]